MLDWFVILTPLLLLGVVALLGFVGCDPLLGLDPVALAVELEQVNPNLGPSSGGTPVKLFGSNFNGVYKVTFDGITALFNTVDNVEIDTISPPHAVGTADVIVYAKQTNSSGDLVEDDSDPLPFTYVAIGFTQMQGNSAPAGNSIQVTLANPTTAGNILIAAVSYQGAGPVTVKDNLGNAFTSVGKHSWFQGQAEMFFLAGIAGGPVTVTATGGTGPLNICLSEYSGGVSMGAVSGNNSPNTGTVPEDISGVAVTPAMGNAVYVVAFAIQGSNANFAAGTGFAGHSSAQDSAVLVADTMSPVTAAQIVATASPASFLAWVVLAAEIQT